MNWTPLTSTQAVLDLAERSHQLPCLIFKHSTTCPVSSIAKMRLESQWDFAAEELEIYYLDLLNHREVSHFIAENFAVQHESPQVLLIRQGVCTYDNSHLDISVAEIRECYGSPA